METVLGDKTFEEAKRVLAGVIGAALWSNGQRELSLSATPADYRDLLRSLEILVKNPGDTEAMSILSQGDGKAGNGRNAGSQPGVSAGRKDIYPGGG